MSEDRGATQEVENRRSVHGVVASLIRAAEIRRFESVDRSPPASGQPKSSTALLEASTQTSPLCLSRSSSFDWVNEPSDPIDFEATVFPEQITTVLQPEPGPSAVEPDGTQKGKIAAPYPISLASEESRIVARFQGDITNASESYLSRARKASQDIDESIAMLLEYADDLTSSSSVRTGHKFLSEKELNAIDGFGKMAQADDSSSSAKCASPSALACNVQLDTRLADSTANGKQ
ncbi:unnamed protein product [Toxocara canis]|uniref:Uncharacterized protein n=1 Tax=Toxocara canis TaxID=6265 RepID=A0A183VFA9_TOXCA|nr:unnamed protein product [Toxocara canis]